jgi:hypothetical protein
MKIEQVGRKEKDVSSSARLGACATRNIEYVLKRFGESTCISKPTMSLLEVQVD